MFKKLQDTSLSALTMRRQAVIKPRLHKFPPLRRHWAQAASDGFDMGDPAAYQQQLMQGFQDGLNRGFAQGMEEGKQEGHQEGMNLGYEEGVRKGLNEGKLLAKQQFNEAAKPLESVVQELNQYLANYEQRRREELLQLVEKVTCQVIRCELALQPNQLMALVEEALSSLPQQPEQIRVHLNSDEFRRINDADPQRAQQWGLTADPDLSPGECRVVTDTSEMDIGCQHRLEQCLDMLKETLLPETKDE